MIENLETLKEYYSFVSSSNEINCLIDYIEQMEEKRPRYIRKSLHNNSTLEKIEYLKSLYIKKVRKKLLLNITREQIFEFNNTLKEKEDKRFILNLHNHEYWVASFLELIKTRAERHYYSINSSIGYDDNRLDDYRIFRDESYLVSSYRSLNQHIDFFDNENWSEKIDCKCIKSPTKSRDNRVFELFKVGENYFYRIEKRTNRKVVYDPLLTYVFEDDSFEEYFMDKVEVRNKLLTDLGI